MALPKMTEMQKKMYNAVGHQVEIRLVNDAKRWTGKCINYTKPLDNEPEIASIDLRIPGCSSIIEITEEEIAEIILLDT